MFIRRIKFIWGSSGVIQARWRLGLFGFYAHRPGFPGTGLAISVRGLLGWTAGLAMAGYLAGAGALTVWFQRQPHNLVHFADVMTWPARGAHVRELRGRMWIAQSRDALTAGKFGEAFFLLRRGVAAAPGDYAARRALADIYLVTGARPTALAVMEEGARIGLPDRAWRQQAFAIGRAGEDWEFVLRFCDLCLPRLAAPAQRAERDELLANKAVALIGLNRPNEALAIVQSAGERPGLALRIQQGAALLALGRADEAAELSAGWEKAASAVDRPALMQFRAEALRRAGHFEEMKRVLADLIAVNPADPALSAFAVEECAKANRGAAAALDDYLFRFGGSAANLQRVAQKLAEIPDVPLVKRVVAAARERGYAAEPFQSSWANALLRAGEWNELARVIAAMKPERVQANPEARLWLTWIRQLSDTLVSPATASAGRLTEFLGGQVLSLDAEQMTVTALRKAGRDEAARDAVEIALRFYPNSPWLRTQQTEVQGLLAAKAAAAPPAAPTPRAPEPARDEFFQRLDAAMAAARWEEAGREIDALRARRPAPGWLAAHDGELLRRELRIDQARGDRPALQLTARLLLNGGASGADEVLAFASGLDPQAARADAVFLAKTVLEKLPGNQAAMELLAKLQPKAEARTDDR